MVTLCKSQFELSVTEREEMGSFCMGDSEATCPARFLCCSACGWNERRKVEGSKLLQSFQSLLWSENKGRTGTKALLTPLPCALSLCPVTVEWTHSESSSSALKQI